MKLSQLKFIDKVLIECHLDNPQKFNQGEAVDVWQENDICYLAQDGKVALLDIKDSSSVSQDYIDNLILADNTRWYVESQNKKNMVWLSAISTDGNDISLNIDIGINEYITEQLYEKGFISSDSIQLATDWINEEFLFIDADSNVVFTKVYPNQKKEQLHFLGRNYTAEVNEINDSWQIERLTKNSSSKHYQLLAMEGEIHFVEHSLAKKLNNSTSKAILAQHIENFGDYIEIWKQYSERQWKDVSEKAVEIGYVKYTEYEETGVAYEWRIFANEEQISIFKANWDSEGLNKEEIQLSPVLPDYFSNHDDSEHESDENDKKIGKTWRAQIIEINSDNILIRNLTKKERNSVPFENDKGFLFLSIHSTLVQRERQQKALIKIQTKINPIPTLHGLLQGMAVPVIKSKKHKWKSPKVNELFKHGTPTTKQKEAIELGVNNLDVTVIIGPPGTGKTQVITALQQRLIEISQNKNGINKSVLLTSYQHDAVDNALSRSNVLGLAGLRIGGKNKEITDTTDSIDTIEQWSVPIRQNITDILQQDKLTEWIQELKNHLLMVRIGDIPEKTKSKQQVDSLLKILQAEYSLNFSSQTMDWWESFKVNSSSFTAKLLNTELQVIYALRTTSHSFLDDGMERTIALKLKLEGLQSKYPNIQLISADDIVVLNTAIELLPNEIESFDFSQLSQLKDSLLDKSLPDFRTKDKQMMLSEYECQQLDNLYDEIIDVISRSKSLGYLMVLKSYKTALTSKVTSVEDAIGHYTAVLGATCQQSVGGEMQELKTVNTGGMLFENVIVDEAARATPLDLMIPIAMAKKRIVLVGDHRQLPHMLDDKVKENLFQQNDFEAEQEQMLETSLFQRLVTNFNKLEKEDGQPKRVIMLDTQFRMHSVLGDFISENFYENHGLPPIKSVRPASDFNHQISGYDDAVCAWIDVQQAPEKRPHNGHGWHRPCEAKLIAKEAKRILDEKPELSVGVISFYRGQVTSLFKEMGKEKLTQKTSGDYQVHPDYASLQVGDNIGEERLRIGTVDAFQGKEFDVVLISMVRTLPDNFTFPSEFDKEEREKSLNKKYGFLRIDNRLNVAFSRQRALLILVGDTSLATHPETKKIVPSLTNFLTLCGGSHGKVF